MKILLNSNDKKAQLKLKQLICFEKINKVIKTAGLELKAIEVIDKKITLHLGDTSHFKMQIIIAILNTKKYFLKINDDVFFYYDDVQTKKQELLCKAIIQLIYKNIINIGAVSLVDFINNNSIEFGDALKTKLYIDKIRDLNNRVDLDLIRNYWPKTKSIEVLKLTNNGTRLNLVLKDENSTRFLKIFADDDKYVKSFIELYGLISKEINTPELLDYKNFRIDNDNYYWGVSFQYLPQDEDSQNILKEKRMSQAVTELVKLHKLKIDISKFDHLNYKRYSEDLFNLIKDKNAFPEDCLPIVRKAFSFLENNLEKLSPISLCHFDLRIDNFMLSNDNVYLIDFDNMQFDYLIFDLAIMIKSLILSGKTESADDFIKKYFKINQDVKYDKDLLYYSTLLVSFTDLIKSNKTEPDFFKNDFETINKYFSLLKI